MNSKNEGRNMPERTARNGSFDPMDVLDEEGRAMIFGLAERRMENQRLMELERCRTVRAVERDRAESQVALAEIDHKRQLALESHQRDLYALSAAAQLVARSCLDRPDYDYHEATLAKEESAWLFFTHRTAWSVTVERRRQR